ncbi:MAG: hypothetical protein ABJI92_18985, partial [Kangiellaceae bacterium]
SNCLFAKDGHVCVLHLKPSFLPVDIQHNQCPCRFFNPREIQVNWSQNYTIEILHCHVRSKHIGRCNKHVIIPDAKGTTYTL